MKLKMYFIKYSWLIPVPFTLLMKFYSKKIIYPFYHSTSNTQPKFIKHLYRVKSINEFKKDIFFLLKYFKPISVENFVKYTKGEFVITNNSILLSFDDGLSSINEIAPFLVDNKIPALFFINNDFVNNKALFYRYKVSLLIDKIYNNEISKPKKLELIKVLGFDFNNKNNLIRLLKKLTHKNINQINELAIILNFSFKDFLLSEKPYLNEKQINNLIESGFYFGGHSRSHINYQLLNEDEQITETFSSINYVEEKFKSKYNFFSFPFSDDNISLKLFKKLKSEKAISFGTAGLKDEANKNITHFQRIPMEYNKNYSAKSILKGELLYYFFKKIVKKNKINRS